MSRFFATGSDSETESGEEEVAITSYNKTVAYVRGIVIYVYIYICICVYFILNLIFNFSNLVMKKRK